MPTPSLERWHQRLARSAALLATRLDRPPSLEELAAEAAVSPYHFHRIWRSLTGETVGHTVARLRIEASRQLLAASGDSVTQVAMATGFGSSQSFARAFRRQTGATPSGFRQGEAAAGTTAPGDAPIRIEMRDALDIVTLRRVGPDYVALNATFQALWDWADGMGYLPNLKGIYGMPLDDPEGPGEDGLRYDAAIAVGKVAAPLPMVASTLPAGPYACLRHHGAHDLLEEPTQYLVGTWLPNSGHEPADFPLVYHAHNDPDVTPIEELVTDILLPLRVLENA